MKIDDIEEEIISSALDVSFITGICIIDKNEEAIKARLVIDESFFVQIYVNIVTGTCNFVLVLNNQRVYGRDCQDGRWHRHPFEDSESHDFGEEGTREISIREFLWEVQEIVDRMEI